MSNFDINIFQQYENTFRALEGLMAGQLKNNLTSEERLMLFVRIFLSGVLFDKLNEKAALKGLSPEDLIDVIIAIKSHHTISTKLSIFCSGDWKMFHEDNPCDCITCLLLDKLEHSPEFKMAVMRFAKNVINGIAFDTNKGVYKDEE
jgi:hypothetical protein